MKLGGGRVARNATQASEANLLIRRERIYFDDPDSGRSPELDLRGYLILPGLINAHDHLEFNLFPRMGRGPYPNAAAWARDIYRPEREPIRQHLRVPKPHRLFWGGLKNLLSGVTTVAHHNPYDAAVFQNSFPVRVVKRFGWAHSLDFSPDLLERYRRTPARWPFIVHAAEGTDQHARQEIGRLDQSGILGPRTVLVHAVATDSAGRDLIRRRKASIIWCPSSNRFTLGRTVPLSCLRSGVAIALGTDSALSGHGDLVDEMRIALQGGRMRPEEIYEMVTRKAARILRLDRGEGEIRNRGVADLVVVRDRRQTPAAALSGLCPELVLIGGAVKLVSPALGSRLPQALLDRLQPLELEGRGRWLVAGAVSRLYRETSAILGQKIRLAGRSVRI